jgi:hypothetical protein
MPDPFSSLVDSAMGELNVLFLVADVPTFLRSVIVKERVDDAVKEPHLVVKCNEQHGTQ